MEGTPRVCGHHFLRTKKKGTLCGKPAPKELDGTNYCLVHYRMAVTDQAKNANFMSSQPIEIPAKERETVKTYATKKESPETSSSEEGEEEDKFEVLDSGRRGVKRTSQHISHKKQDDRQMNWMNEQCLRDIKKSLGLLGP